MANPYNPPKLLPGQLNPSEVAPQAGPNGKYIIGARPAPGTPNAGLSATHGMGPHGATPGQPGVRGGMTPTQVRAMQQFLTNHGFQVAQDGVLGPQTKSAAAAFRANHKGGDAWSKTNGIGLHPGLSATTGMGPHHGTGYNPNPVGGGKGSGSGGGKGSGSGGAGSGSGGAGSGGGTGTGGTDAGGALQALLQSLLGGGGNVGSGYDAQSFGNAAAAPDDAAAAALQRQIGANPKQEAQNQADISQWYGLDPKGAGYKLSVLGRLAQAKAGDAAATKDVQGNMGDLARSLAGSIGGAANDGSGSVLAAGQNSAGTVAALGQAQSDYESNMDPLLRAEAVGAASREKGTNSQTLADLADKLATAQGQGKADRAAGVMGATDKNNALAQQRFANQGNLLSTLAQMQAADPNSATNTLATAKTQAQINEINAQTAKAKAAAMHLVNGSSTPKQTKASLGDLTAQIGGIAGIGADHRLPAGMSIGGVAHLVGTTLQSAGIPKSDPRYQRIAQTIMGSFLDPNGNPLNVPPGWFGPNTQ